jgi:FkbM family methyltransferase
MTDLTLTDQEFIGLQYTELDSADTDYDSSALSRAKSKWIFGHWQDLADMNIKQFTQYPEREKIALLIGAAHQQLDNTEETKKHIQLSRLWGCDNKLIAKVLLSGVSNTMGKVHALNNNDERSQTHFNESLTLLLDDSEAKQIRQARSITELSNLGLLPQVAKVLGEEHKKVNEAERPTDTKARAKMLESEIELVNHNIALSHQKNQLYQSYSKANNEDTFEEHLKRISPSQLGQDLWVLEKTEYKRGGFFVEFGATDGILLSNTFLLEKKFGWKGICAEPNPVFYEKLILNRECVVSDSCIAGKSGDSVRFILADEYGGIDTFCSKGKHKDKVTAFEGEGKVINLETISLDDFLRINGAPKQIDYLSIDTEGSEYAILKSFPFDKWDVRFITVEHNFEPQREKIFNLLSSFGYVRTKKEWDDWYVCS